MEAEARNGLRRTVGLLMVVTLLGLVSSGCARVQSHFALPDLAMGDPAFGPTIEAYTATRVAGGNTVDLLLNGDEIFPAILDAIRSAQSTITYAQYFYEQGEMPEQIAAALAERCQAGIRAHILLDGFGALQMPAAYRETMTKAGCEVATFRPLSPLISLSPFGFGRENNRSHRRILVVDGRVGFTGGVGVSPSGSATGERKVIGGRPTCASRAPRSPRSRARSSRTGSRRPATCSAGARTSRVRPRADR
jgi:cardiolipin synthase A/B